VIGSQASIRVPPSGEWFISATAAQLSGPFSYGDKTDSGRIDVGAKAEAAVVNWIVKPLSSRIMQTVTCCAPPCFIALLMASCAMRYAANLDGNRKYRKIT
jgi:hypothetical protein